MASNGDSNGTNGQASSHIDVPIDAPVETRPHANGNGASITAETPIISTVRGPLGIGSASLQGKIALVTGSGKY